MTTSRELLRETVADFFAVEPGRVGPAFPLSGRPGQGSVARAALDAAIRRRVGLKSRAVYTAATFGELEAEVTGTAQESPPAVEAPPPPAGLQPSAPVACGVDIEWVESLPEASDYWAHEFYAATFTPREIAYCLLQATPRVHFAGRWCAKEALKKCDPDLLAADMKDLEVLADGSGAPHFVLHRGGLGRRLPYALSIAHAGHAAVAVVVRADVPGPSAPPPAPPPTPPTESEKGGGWGALSVVLSLLSLGLAALALARTLGR